MSLAVGSVPPDHLIVPDQLSVPEPESMIVNDLPAVASGIVIVNVPETSKIVPSLFKSGSKLPVLVISFSVIAPPELPNSKLFAPSFFIISVD